MPQCHHVMLWLTIEYRLPACALKNYAPLAAPIFLWCALEFVDRKFFRIGWNPNSQDFRESALVALYVVYLHQVGRGTDISYKHEEATMYDDDYDDGYAEGICSKCGDKQAHFPIPEIRLQEEPLFSICCEATMVDDDSWYDRGEDGMVTYDGQPYSSYSAWPRKEQGD